MTMTRKLAVAIALLGAAAQAAAEPVRLDFTFRQEAGPATATGYVMFETDLIANPGDNDIDLPNPAVLELNVNVSGATSGNGSFGIEDFCSLVFDTQGGTLDFTRELVGQPTLGDPWATTVPEDARTPSGGGGGTSGDFNLFACGSNLQPGERYAENRTVQGSMAPNGVWYFTLAADGGGGDAMRLVSMAPAGVQGHQPVPASTAWSLAGLMVLLAGLGMAVLRTRSAR